MGGKSKDGIVVCKIRDRILRMPYLGVLIFALKGRLVVAYFSKSEPKLCIFNPLLCFLEPLVEGFHFLSELIA